MVFAFVIREQRSKDPNAYAVANGDSSAVQALGDFRPRSVFCIPLTGITAAPTIDVARSCVVLFRGLHQDPLTPLEPLKVQISTPPAEIIPQSQQPCCGLHFWLIRSE